jgi:hypothetical protein
MRRPWSSARSVGWGFERLGHKEAGRSGVRVVAQQLHHDVQEDGFAVTARAVEEGQDLGADVAGDRVSEEQVEVVDHLLAFGVVAERVGEEAQPARDGCLLEADGGGVLNGVGKPAIPPVSGTPWAPNSPKRAPASRPS